MWTSFVKSNDEETNSVRSASVLLGVDLCLWVDSLEHCTVSEFVGLVLSAIEETKRLAGIGRL